MKNSMIFEIFEEICLKYCILQQCLAKDIKLSSFLGGNSSNFYFPFIVCF